jgi:hypothetical protein
MIFDSYDLTPVLLGTGKCPRSTWYCFTELDLMPGVVPVGQYKAVFDLRGDGGQATGGLSVDTNLGWKVPTKLFAIVPSVYELGKIPRSVMTSS